MEKVRLFDVELDMETLTEYSGQGRCKVLDYETYEMATDIIDVQKLKTWSKEKPWINESHYYDHNGLKVSCWFRQTSARYSLEDLLERWERINISIEEF